ncbi:MAG: hypothetical protein QOJ12_1829 [Thermoleophilales bacterium]|jgi:hypothetical protein|nr:hypothetical protein [Thermoleophilales bacterium]
MQTLLIAALASGAAAIVVSRIWDKGTIVASAMTPVIVAVVSEMLRKPIESEVVRRPVRAVGSVRASRGTWRRGEARPPSGRTPSVMAPPPAGVDEGLRHREEGLEPGPVKVYSTGSNRVVAKPGRRRLHLKIAIATGLVAFLIAALALTLPELIFGGSVTGGKRDTTYFGGGGQTQKKSNTSGAKKKDTPATGQTSTSGTTTQTAPNAGAAQTTPGSGSTTTTPPSSTPQQTAPAPTTPVPTTPAPPTP